MKIKELIQKQIERDSQYQIIHEFKLGSFFYNDYLELMAARLLHFYYLIEKKEESSFYTNFIDLFDYKEHELTVECMVYAFDNSGYFDSGTSPRGQWMTEEGKIIYENFMKNLSNKN